MQESNKAKRFNEGKIDYTLLDFECLEEMVKGMAYGEQKYGRWNWKKECDNPEQHLQSAMRHLVSMLKGEEIDKESGVRHAGLVGCNMQMYLYHTKGLKTNDYCKPKLK